MIVREGGRGVLEDQIESAVLHIISISFEIITCEIVINEALEERVVLNSFGNRDGDKVCSRTQASVQQ